MKLPFAILPAAALCIQLVHLPHDQFPIVAGQLPNIAPFAPQVTQAPAAEQPQPPPTSAKAATSSSVTCDFAPWPTGTCELGSMTPSPFNCSMFFICTTFGPIMQTCPNGTVFDFEKTKCLAKNATACTGCCLKTDCTAKNSSSKQLY